MKKESRWLRNETGDEVLATQQLLPKVLKPVSTFSVCDSKIKAGAYIFLSYKTTHEPMIL